MFVYPVDPSKDFIKRVIGEPGDTVEVKHKQVFINGEKIDDPYGQFVEGPGDNSRLTPRDNFGPVTVPPDQVFVMGDNRDRSYDSRFWGFVPLDDVRGQGVRHLLVVGRRGPLGALGTDRRSDPLGRVQRDDGLTASDCRWAARSPGRARRRVGGARRFAVDDAESGRQRLVLPHQVRGGDAAGGRAAVSRRRFRGCR